MRFLALVVGIFTLRDGKACGGEGGKRGAGIQLGTLPKLRDFDLKHSEVKKKLGERYGEQVPLDMEVISPQAIFDDPRLITIED